MDSRQKLIRDRFATVCTVVLASLLVAPMTASAQVRVKKPDRGVYQSPHLTDVSVEPLNSTRPQQSQPQDSDQDMSQLIRGHEPLDSLIPKQPKKLVEVELEVQGETVQTHKSDAPVADGSKLDAGDQERKKPRLQRVNHEDVVLVAPDHEPIMPSDVWMDAPASEGPLIWNEGDTIHDATCDGCPSCLDGCGTIGCDSLGSCSEPWYRGWANSSISCDPGCWFGSIELLLMWGRGDRLPPLVTTTIDNPPDPDTAGELGQRTVPPPLPTTPLTQVLVGGDSALGDPSVLGNGKIFDELRAGGRITLGTWLDNQQCRSLVLRGWFAGEQTFGFNTNQDATPVIARPFLNVSDNQVAAQDTQLIAFPDRASGSISVQASSDVFGGDISVRQFWYGRYGGTIDLLYGYQYMRMNEDLSISSISTSLDDDFAPLGSVLAIADSFDTENEFHGGQLGVATRYREGCYSFNSLAKVAFGSLARRAQLAGVTFTSIDGANAVDPNGLLVRSTNAGTITDHTFGWVPEIDLTLGWHRYPRFDLTFGYNLIAMTEALQVSKAIDPRLAVNLSDPPTGAQRPAALLRYGTYYVQGIHFGLQYVY